eukprot:Selendium_serpulae@DN6368_c0_g1_i13.p3
MILYRPPVSSLTPTEEKTLLVASLCHDVGHPGRNNAFFINVCDPLATLYNDISVLENYHSSLTFEVLNTEEFDLFCGTHDSEYRRYRETIIKLILATDMKLHFEGITQFKVRRSSPDFNPENNAEDKLLLIKTALKAADICHGALEWDEHFAWSHMVSEEFYLQGDEESRLGLPKTALCDREKKKEMAKSQVGFLQFVVEPLYAELSSFNRSGVIQSICVTRLTENRSHWSAMVEKQKKEDELRFKHRFMPN